MKTLSIRQPWAQLICSGIKDVENRTWKTNYRGKILIHAPAKFDDRGISDCFNEKQVVFIMKEYGLAKYKYEQKILCSAIIGSVEIIDCVQNHDSIWAQPGCWHYVLQNPVLFDNSILNVKGRLSFWDYEGEITL